jgi:hypothetical protein
MSDLGYWYGSALQGSRDNFIPPQAIPLSKKNDKWRERCLDAFESIGLRQFKKNLKYTDIFRMINGKMSFSEMSEAMPQYRELERVLNDVEIPTFLRHYDIIGIIINALAGELMSNSDKFSINTNDDVSSNEYLRTKTDKLWETIQTDLERELETRLLNLGINPNVPQEAFQDPQQYQQYLQQIQSKKAEMTPAAIQTYMDADWKTVAAKWASLKLEEDRINHDMDMMDYENFIEYLATGRCFRHMFVSYDYYKPEKWSMMNTFFSEDLETKRAEKGDYVGRVHQFSRSQVLTRYGHKLTAKQKEDMAGVNNMFYNDNDYNFDRDNNVSYKKMFESHFHNLQIVPFENYPEYQFNLDMQDALGVPLGEQKIMNRHGEYETVPVMLPKLADVTGDLGYRGHTNFQMLRNDISIRNDLMTVTEVYWKSFKKIGYLSYYDENNNLTSALVTEDILPEFLSENEIKKLKNISLMDLEKKQEANTIVWDYMPEVWQGTKITGVLNGPSQGGTPETYYLDIKPCEFQIKGDGNMFDVLLPVAGMIDVGLAPKIEPYQVTYNLVMNQIFNLLEKEIGLFFIFDINFLPSEFRDWGDTEDTLLYMRDIAKDIGIVPVDSSKQNLVGGANFNQFAAQNLSFSSQIQDRVNLAEFIKNKAFEQVGMTPQRLGSPTKYETAEGVRQSQDASYSQTEQYFSKFSSFKKNALELQLSVAQYCQKEGIDLQVFYTQIDATQAFLRESDPDFHLRNLGITPISNSKKRKELEVFKQYLLNTNTLGTDELSLAELISSDAMSEVIEAARGARVARQQQEQAASEQRMQEIQTQQEELRKTEQQKWQLEEMSKDKDRETDIRVAAINAAGRASDKQSDQEGFDYITNLTNLSLQQTKMQSDATNKQLETEIKREKVQSDKEIAMKEIQLKIAELANRRAISKDNVQIARMNKN